MTKAQAELSGDSSGGEDGGDDDNGGYEWISMADHVTYLAPLIRTLALLHMAIACSMMLAYYYLKVIIMC